MSGFTLLWIVCFVIGIYNSSVAGKNIAMSQEYDNRKWFIINIALGVFNILWTGFCGFMVVYSSR